MAMRLIYFSLDIIKHCPRDGNMRQQKPKQILITNEFSRINVRTDRENYIL
jgi:hypothetical protein